MDGMPEPSTSSSRAVAPTAPSAGHAWFVGRRAILATMHGKERVLAPIFGHALGIEVVVPPGFDTDRFGTFTGEVARTGGQLDTARRKAEAALDATGADLAVASEGSFGPHPAIPFIPGNIELVLLLDRAGGLEIVGTHVATELRHAAAEVATPEEAVAFAATAGFPEHGLIVRRDGVGPDAVVKGIHTERALRDAVARLAGTGGDGRVTVENDLRAMANPTRMRAIARAAEELVEASRRTCRTCGAPGPRVVDRRPGLPCRWCRLPTEATLAVVYGCGRCGSRVETPRPDGRTEAEPGECGFCNP